MEKLRFSDLAFQIKDEERKLGHQTAAVALDDHEVGSVTVVRLTIHSTHKVSHGFWFHVFIELY